MPVQNRVGTSGSSGMSGTSGLKDPPAEKCK